jgi:hypothetical protein
MFLAQRITTFNIYFENVTLPAHIPHPVLQPVTENHLKEKQRLLGKIKDVISRMNSDAVWKSVDSLEQLADISREHLTRFLSAAEGLSHLQQDTFLNKSDRAKQRS